MNKTCESCCHFRLMEGDRIEYGSCRRYPLVFVFSDESQGFVYPDVDLTDYCGEFSEQGDAK